MRFYWGVAAACVLGIAVAAPPASKTSTAKTGTTKTTWAQTKATAARKAPAYPAVHTIPSKSTSRPATSARKVAARPQYAPRQGGPTPDRYKEIQNSLISKGYLQGTPTGVWDQSSVEAMKKFQADQKLDATGKITSKSIISLGLGPRDESAPNLNTPPTNK
jgi:peptidoglycan hydrolase-like protein with peptidoglycan-binding domain